MASVSFSLVTLTTLRASDVMTTDAVTLAEYEQVETAIELLTSAGCRFVPVVRNRRVVGVIDERLVVGQRRPAHDATASVATIHHTASLADVIDRLVGSGGDHLVVVDDHGHVMGVVTAIAIVRLLDAALAPAGR